jgi:uncharacterized protein (TIGR00730 family)
MKSIAVYCGASHGSSPEYTHAARALGEALVDKGIGLVYGGGNVGLMGEIADAVLLRGGQVTGVIPKALMDREVGHRGLTVQHIVTTMHERKQMMADLSDAFIAMPGGIGTFEELFEMLTWNQLAIHNKPIGILNAGGFYDKLLDFMEHVQGEGFLRGELSRMVKVDSDPARLVAALQADAALRR